MLLVLMASSVLTAAGEEIGGRGFLLPKLTEIWNVKAAIIGNGLIWAVWHFPLMIAGAYQSQTNLWYRLPVFTLEIVSITVIFAYLRLKSNSV